MLLLVFDTKEECDKFTILYEKYRRVVFYTVRRFVGDEFIAEDLLQDIYIIIARNLHKIDMEDDRKSRNYLITIARNYSLSYLRKKNSMKEDSMDEDMMQEELISDDDEVLRHIVDKERLELAVREVRKLDDKYRMVLELKYINEFNEDEIASFLSINRKSVQMRLYRARKMLRKRLQEGS